MWLHAVIIFLSATTHMTTFVTARFCEGGHICSLPRECCTQGCCPPYQSGPRQLPPPSEHVLNLFFISHWFFWCVVVAIILAVLCAYSLWRKRRTLCGWGFSDHHAQSEGDSAGSCYAPPQYSRCNSFHHPPPPYTEVTSKPDLYPLVFTCNSDNGKSGSSYLMVQYFRNYIVRPAVAGSLSAASTIDSLSSSFICNANEANTLVPPPYSRAASPEIGGFASPHYPLHQHHHPHQQQHHSTHQQPSHLMHQSMMQHSSTTHQQQHSYAMPRSASQLVCASSSAAGGRSATPDGQSAMEVAAGGNLAGQQVYQQHARLAQQQQHYAVISLPAAHHMPPVCPQVTESEPDVATHASAEMRTPSTGFAQSQSDQHFRYLGTSNSSISDIFVNAATATVAGTTTATCPPSHNPSIASALEGVGGFVVGSGPPTCGGTPVIFSNGRIKPHPLHRTSTNPTQFVAAAEAHREPVYTSLNSISVAEGGRGDSAAELHRLRHSLETCNWQLMQYQAATGQGGGGHPPHPGSAAPNTSTYGGDSPLRLHELGGKKFAAGDEALRSYLTSGSCSAVSSLANIGTPSSPPQATSPTGEVKELLDQIRQLHEEASYDEDDGLWAAGPTRPALQHTVSSPAAHEARGGVKGGLKRFSTMSESRSKTSLMSPTTSPRGSGNRYATAAAVAQVASARPATLQQSSKKKFCSPKPNKAMYIPMAASSGVGLMKSPVGANFFGSRGSRVRKAWISRSAPTTPGTTLPPNRMGDDSPLLNEHDEEFDEQIAEIE